MVRPRSVRRPYAQIMSPIGWVLIGKTALLLFLGLSLVIVTINYIRRRRCGTTPWRPPNSLIVGYDAPRAHIEHPAGPDDTDGQLPPPA